MSWPSSALVPLNTADWPSSSVAASVLLHSVSASITVSSAPRSSRCSAARRVHRSHEGAMRSVAQFRSMFPVRRVDEEGRQRTLRSDCKLQRAAGPLRPGCTARNQSAAQFLTMRPGQTPINKPGKKKKGGSMGKQGTTSGASPHRSYEGSRDQNRLGHCPTSRSEQRQQRIAPETLHGTVEPHAWMFALAHSARVAPALPTDNRNSATSQPVESSLVDLAPKTVSIGVLRKIPIDDPILCANDI